MIQFVFISLVCSEIDFGGLETEYMATFTPSGEGLKTIVIHQDTVSDAAGNGNYAPNTFSWTYDSSSPTSSITSSEISGGSVNNDSSVDFAFTSNESTTNLIKNDISVVGGSLTDFSGSGTSYSATFTPTGEGLKQVSIAGGAFTDAAGNNNIASNTFNWTYDSTEFFINTDNSIEEKAKELKSSGNITADITERHLFDIHDVSGFESKTWSSVRIPKRLRSIIGYQDEDSSLI